MYGCVFHKEDGFCEKFSDDRCKSYCVMGPCQYAIPSHADSIRAMSDEEMAEWICKTQFREGDFCPPKHEWQYCQMADGCRECWLSWLKAPVGKDGNSL